MPLKTTGILLFVGLILACTLASLSRVHAKPSATVALARASARPALAMVWPQSDPTLQISTEVTTTLGGVITVPIHYAGNGANVSSLAFSLDMDQTCLGFDPGDHDGNGLPDAVRVHTPPGVNTSVAVDLLDEDGELDIIIADFFPPFVTLPDRAPLLEVRLSAVCQVDPGATRSAAVRFSAVPTPSFGNSSGAPVPGNVLDGFVTIIGPPLPPTATPTPTVTPTPTLIPTRPPTTPTLVPTAPPYTVVDYFKATPQYPHIRLQWQTQQEVNTVGFYVYRKQLGRIADFMPISTLLPGQGAQGGLYSFTDSTVQTNIRYLYLLVEEKTNGARTEFIELMITSSLTDQQPYQLLLPLIAR